MFLPLPADIKLLKYVFSLHTFFNNCTLIKYARKYVGVQVLIDASVHIALAFQRLIRAMHIFLE